MCVGLYKALKDDWLKINSVQSHNTSVQYVKANMTWQDRLDILVSMPTREDAQNYLDTIAQPALTEMRDTLISKGQLADIIFKDERVRLVIGPDDLLSFVYGLRIRAYTVTGTTEENISSDQAYYRVEVFLEHGGQQYDVMGYTQEQITADIVTQYERYLHYVHLSHAELVD